MNLNDIAVFLKVVDAGSFSAAARLLGQPKTSVSRKVAALETALGARLLQRTTRSLALTDAGRHYYEECSEGLAAIEAANRGLSEAQAEPSGTLRISAPTDMAGYFLADALAECLSRFPRIKAEVILTDERLNLIEERIDLAFRGGPLKDSALVARQLHPGRFLFCASPRYLAAAGTPETPAELRHHECIIMQAVVDNAHWTIGGPQGTETVPVHGRVSANTMQFALRSAIVGLGIARLPGPMAAADIRARRLATVLDGWDAGIGGMYAVYPSSRHLSPAVKALIEIAADHFARIATPG